MCFLPSMWACTILCALGLTACTVTEPVEFGEERKVVLESVADRLVIPGYQALETIADSLLLSVELFVTQPDQAHLDVARNTWLSALMAWERVVTYDFGPATSTFGSLNYDVGTFPANVPKIEAAIANGDTSTQNFERDKRGFYALEYLLFSDASKPIVSADSTQRRAYLLALARHLHNNLKPLRAAWITYRSGFVQNSGTDAGSSMSLLFNAMNMSYEMIKNFKIAIPAGRRLGQLPAPQLVEAYHSGNSIRALKAHIRGVFELWSGNEPSQHGFQYYLRVVPNGDRLIADTKLQIDSVNIALDAFADNERLSDLIASNDPRIDTLVEQTQKMSRFLKSELSSLIGIAITYSSGDGD